MVVNLQSYDDNILAFYYNQFSEAKKIKEYDDLNYKFNKLYSSLASKIRKKEYITKNDKDSCDKLIKLQYQRIINDRSNELQEKIQKRRTKGQIFFEHLKNIKKIRIESEMEKEDEKELEIEQYVEKYRDLIDIEKEIDEKITIEKYQKKQSVIMIIIGFILGIISTIITPVFLG